MVMIVTATMAGATVGEGAEVWKPELMDRAVELREALAAGPPAIQGEAGVYVLTGRGYELVRESGNNFHCIVSRSQPDAFEPQCLDAEGSATLLQQILLRGELQMKGVRPESIRSEIDEAWASGRLTAPARPGLNYMLSTKNRVPVGPETVIPYGPHLMFYAPNLTDEDIGGDRMGKASPIFMINTGRPSGYVIVPLPGYKAGELAEAHSH